MSAAPRSAPIREARERLANHYRDQARLAAFEAARDLPTFQTSRDRAEATRRTRNRVSALVALLFFFAGLGLGYFAR